jgi:hypothetical protein
MPVRRPIPVDQAPLLLSRPLQVERRDLAHRTQRNALAVHYGIQASELAGVTPDVVERMTLRVQTDRLENSEQIAEELRGALVCWLFRIGMELQGAAKIVTDERVVDRLSMCVDEIDDCMCYIRQVVYRVRD